MIVPERFGTSVAKARTRHTLYTTMFYVYSADFKLEMLSS